MNTSPSSALTPVPDEQRVFTGYSHASLWFSLGVGLLVMQVGAFLVPAVGTREALLAIVMGSLVGSGLLAWTARRIFASMFSALELVFGVPGRSFAKHNLVALSMVALLRTGRSGGSGG